MDRAASAMMKAVGERYVRAFNKAHKRTGTLWEGRFRSSIVDSERYLLTCYRYIELNPVRAGLAAHPSEYLWSSYAANAAGATSDVITPHELYMAISEDADERRREYRAMFGADLSEDELRAIRESVSGGFALAGAVLHGRIESHTGMRSQRVRRHTVLEAV